MRRLRALRISGGLGPSHRGQGRRFGGLAHEPFWVGGVGGIEHPGTVFPDEFRPSVVDVGGGVEADTRREPGPWDAHRVGMPIILELDTASRQFRVPLTADPPND